MTSLTKTSLSNKRILLIVSGGIAAYKGLNLVRRLRERGASVVPVMTAGAKAFITPLALASVAGAKVHDELFSLTDEAEMGHIELSRAADLVVVAPATANILAKMAGGLADDLASTLLLATDKRTLVAPAMNLRMWLHPATKRNIATLRADGVLFCGPEDGAMACGEFGPGRMSEPLAIVAAIEAALAGETILPLPPSASTTSATSANSLPLAGRRVVVTSGPTHEPLDPVRFIANRSSGKQGHAIAAAAARAGADVILVSGPVTIPSPQGVTLRPVETAREMLAAVEAALPADIFIAAAAVADWRVSEEAAEKLKKTGGSAPVLALSENPDILATVSRPGARRPALVVGFAAETENWLDHARAKLARKGCDMIVLNDVGAGTGTFGGDTNEVTLVTAAETIAWPRLSKIEIAERLIETLGRRLEAKQP
jgi:phosphopantothenoylcysteine decarboxylase/phosphopantothenate--cysteine ligase